jgi:hypothetical protein
MLPRTGAPCRHWPSYDRGTFRDGRNAAKREKRREIERLKLESNVLGGWKKRLRIQQETGRMFARALA